MSRIVPLDKALNDEDRRYLRQLGAHGMALEERVDATYPPDAEALAAFEKAERKRAAELNGVGLTAGDQADLMSENDRLRAELAEMRRRAEVGLPPETQPETYNGWSKAALEAEVDRVNAEDENAKISKGTVADMKAALTEYFAE